MFNGLAGSRVLGGGRGCAFFKQSDYLIDFGGEEIQRGKDTTIRPEIILLHHFFIINRVADVNIAIKRDIEDGGVKIDNIWRRVLGVEIGIDALHKSCFART